MRIDRVLFWASAFSVLLVLIKAGAYWATGSLLVLASLFDSASDSLVSAFNGYIQRIAKAGPDREHPYGHGGFEVVSSLAQGVILSTLGIVIIVQSFDHLFLSKQEFLNKDQLSTGIAVLAFAAFSGLAITAFLRHYEKKLDRTKRRSLSLQADRAHYLTDFFANGASAIGLLLVHITGYAKLDAMLGFVAGGFILSTAYPVLKNAVRDILHHEAEPEVLQEIEAIAKGANSQIIGVHRLRARRNGPTLLADFHLKLPAKLRLEQAHDIGDQVVIALKKSFPMIDAVIHLDPDTEPDDDLW